MRVDAYDVARALASLLEAQRAVKSAVVTSYGQDYARSIVAVEQADGVSYILEVRGVQQ